MMWLDQFLADTVSILLLAKSSSEVADLSGLEDANIRLMSFLTGCFCFVVGASIGSFLNVVVYRWPRQMSLSDPPSMCPQCRTPIQRRDNIPVIAWLCLRGRCRACHAPIPIRYPTVELAAGLLFVGFLLVELLSGGTNLPAFNSYSYAGIVWILWYTKWDLVGLYLFHLLLMTTLGAMALMHRDGFVPSWKPWRTTLGIRVACLALAMLILLPHLHPVPLASTAPSWLERCQWMTPVQESFLSNRSWNIGVSLKGLIGGLLGLSVGFLCGTTLQTLIRFHTLEERNRSGLPVALSICGVFLGWQAAVCITMGTVVFTAILRLVKRIVPIMSISNSEIVWLVTLLLLLNWKSMHAEWEQVRLSLARHTGFVGSPVIRESW